LSISLEPDRASGEAIVGDRKPDRGIHFAKFIREERLRIVGERCDSTAEKKDDGAEHGRGTYEWWLMKREDTVLAHAMLPAFRRDSFGAGFIFPWASTAATFNQRRPMKNRTEDADLSGAEFINTNLGNAQFRDVNLAGAQFVDVSLSGARLEDVALTGAVIRNVNCADVSIEDAVYDGMRIDGILVAELLRNYRSQQGGER
jgi:Pentapeptide repeats (8 copies)